MFFHFNLNPDEKLRKAGTVEESTDPKIIRGLDGSIIIDDPDLVKVISVQDGPPTAEDINRTEVLTSRGWLPLRLHPLWKG